MDAHLQDLARQQQGVVAAAALGDHARRRAASARLEVVQPRVYVAQTQPVDAAVLLEALRQSVRIRYALLGHAALWLHGAAGEPEPGQLLVGVPHSTRLRLEPPVRVRRVSEDVLSRVRTRGDCPVVDLEMAVLQSCERASAAAASELLEPLLRDRRTTVVRLRARCRRGLAGSARVRAACDELVGSSLDAAVRRLKTALEARGVSGLECEVRFVSEAGASCYGDLWSVASQTLIEVDGWLTHAVRARYLADRRRDRWMAADHGVLTVRVDVTETLTSLDALADELAALLAARSATASRSAG